MPSCQRASNAASPKTSTRIGGDPPHTSSSRSDAVPRAATSPLACSRVTVDAVGREPHEPLALAVGAVEVDRLAGAGQGIGGEPGRHDVEGLLDPVDRELALDRLRSAAGAVCASQRCTAISFACRRAQNPARAIGRPRPRLVVGRRPTRARRRAPARPRRTSRSRRPVAAASSMRQFADGGAGALRRRCRVTQRWMRPT